MRILYFCGGSYVSGLEIIELSIMAGLAARGHRVHCMVSGWNDGDFIGRLDAAGIPHTTVFLGKISLNLRPRYVRWSLDALSHLPGARRAVTRTLATFRPDVVVMCNRDTPLLLGSVLGRVPAVMHVHEAPPLTPRARRIMAAVAARVRLLVGVSHFVGARLKVLAPERVRVVHNGIPPVPAIAPAGGPGPCTIGICGQIGPWKGHETLIEALALLARRGIAFRCLVSGRGEPEYVAHLRRQSDQRGVGGRIEWRGFVRDQDALYRELDVVVMPSRDDEAFGVTALEAGLRGLPVVASDRGGLPEVVVDGKTGFLVPPSAPAALAERLTRLAGDPDLRRSLGQAARARVLEHFNLERMVGDHEAILEEALS